MSRGRLESLKARKLKLETEPLKCCFQENKGLNYANHR